MKQRIALSDLPSKWRPMLDYLADLHERSTYPAEPPFPCPFETPGAGYVGGKCFGHWDAVHVALDALALGRVDHAVEA